MTEDFSCALAGAHGIWWLVVWPEEKIIASKVSEDNSLNLKIFLPERPLLT
ncbi:hypothetical protein [Aquabacterium lacunae]|uniref:hypothetical protein n=1 Tax=Aquabacterium lacunae TaxID=2528630 RepID=UPI0013EF4919|nr:hypothetical protein [Aquabacterium lacunae]